ncbi:Uncharacterised protein [Vibrio cholerae]|nr:Uncharacterised protein [Vibrio cholerae]CSI59233.1 Uncharacterised protein [Vibrio cholerae]
MSAPSKIMKDIGANASTCASQMPVKPYSQLVFCKPNPSTINSVI